MNYDEARQTADRSGWHWTTMNDGKVRTAWPCVRYTGPIDDPAALLRGEAKAADFERCPPHATREEAERHYYDASLEAAEEITFSTWAGCRVCDTPTKTFLGNRQFSRFFMQPTPLCDEHRTKERLAELRPFSPGMKSIHS